MKAEYKRLTNKSAGVQCTLNHRHVLGISKKYVRWAKKAVNRNYRRTQNQKPYDEY